MFKKVFSDDYSMPAKKNPPKKEVKEKKPRDALDYATDLVSPALSFAKTNFKELFIKFLKVDIVSGLVGIGLLILFALTVVGFAAVMGAPLTSVSAFFLFLSGNLVVSTILIIWSLLAMVVMAWIINSLELTKYLITKEQFLDKYSGIWPLFNRIKIPVLGMMFLNFAILIIALGAPALILYLLAGQEMVFLIALILFMVWIFGFLVLYSFFVQFWKWELVVGGKSVVDSLKNSINLCWKNVIGVIVFDILIFFGAVIIAIPFIGVEFVAEMFLNFALIPAMVTSSGMMIWFSVLGIYVVFRIVMGILRSIVINIVILPYIYSFWAKIRQKPTK
jgi:hypothetical protein